MVLRNAYKIRPLIMILAATMMVIALACGGKAATPTTPPTATKLAPTATKLAPTGPTATKLAPTATTAAPSGGGSVTLAIGSVSTDDLKFNKGALTAKAGAAVVLTFTNNAITQSHNWALVQNGTKDAVATAGLAYPANDWVSPTDKNVVTHTKLIAAGKSEQLTFTAPTAGTYQFVCTFPGHNLTMFGTLTVTP